MRLTSQDARANKVARITPKMEQWNQSLLILHHSDHTLLGLIVRMTENRAGTDIEIYLQTFANKMFEHSKLRC